jgi:hypothetical protein
MGYCHTLPPFSQYTAVKAFENLGNTIIKSIRNESYYKLTEIKNIFKKKTQLNGWITDVTAEGRDIIITYGSVHIWRV